METDGFERYKQDVIKVYREYQKYLRATGAVASAHRRTILRLLLRVTGTRTTERALMIAPSYDQADARKKKPAPKPQVQIKPVDPRPQVKIKLVDPNAKPKRKKAKTRKPSRGGSVWTVSGGLPGLGKR